MIKYFIKGAYITFDEAKQHILDILDGKTNMEIL